MCAPKFAKFCAPEVTFLALLTKFSQNRGFKIQNPCGRPWKFFVYLQCKKKIYFQNTFTNVVKFRFLSGESSKYSKNDCRVDTRNYRHWTGPKIFEFPWYQVCAPLFECSKQLAVLSLILANVFHAMVFILRYTELYNLQLTNFPV